MSLFLPINQNLDYDYPIYHSFFNSNVFPSSLFLLIIFAFGIYLFYSTRYTLSATRLIAFGIFWFFITLSVESSIIPIKDVIYEHRAYLPSIGAFIAIITSIFIVLDLLKSRFQMTDKAVISALIVIVSILSGAAYTRNIIWQDEFSLWEDVVSKSPGKAGGYYNLGRAYYSKGLIDKAIEHYKIALKLKPDYADAHNNIGSAYGSKGFTDVAITHFLIALKSNPDHAVAHLNLGLAYYSKGLIDKAIEHYKIALKLKPDYADAYFNLGVAYTSKGLTGKAIEHYQIALRLKPDFADAHFNLGLIYLQTGIIEKALTEFEITLKINPRDYQAQQLLNYISNLNKIRSH